MSQRFDSLLTNELIINNLTQTLHFTEPTPIQAAAIPAILSGKDVYAGAKTGSGKTMAYLLPLFQRILSGEINRALILAPTRELALQIDEEAMKIVEGQTKVVSIPLYGGVPIDPQILALKAHKPKVLITTPGRVLDLVQEGSLKLSDVQVVVLDEADRMCDMGFAPQVSQIMDLVVDRKQTLLFSATLPDELNEIMNKYSHDPIRIQVDAADTSSDTIEHFVILCHRHDKMKHLLELLSKPDVIAAVFTKTRNKCDEVYDALSRKIEKVAVLHAGLPMSDRERTLRALKEGKIRILVSTDVFSRGIDIDDITHVIQYDLPHNLDDYIHRSGRSGRAGRDGTTVALVDQDNFDQIKLIKSIAEKVKLMTMNGEPLNLDSLQASSRGHGSDHRRGGDQRRGGGGHSRPRGPREDLRDHGVRKHRGPRPPRSERPPQPRFEKPKRERQEQKVEKTNAGRKKSPSLLSKTKSLIKKVFSKKTR